MEELKECGSSEESSSAQNVYDIGDIIVEKSKDITDHEKYVIFKNHFRPGQKYKFKKTQNMAATGLVKGNTYRNALLIAVKRMVSIVSSALCF